MYGSYTKIASGNIKPGRFVKISGDNTVSQCSTGERIYGISKMGTRNLALSGFDDGFVAIAGEAVHIYGPGDPGCELVLGGTVAAGDYLKSDSDGCGVVADTNLDDYGARTAVAGVATEQIPVEVLIGERSTT